MSLLAAVLICCLSPTQSSAQCLDSSNVYSFQYNGHAYEVVKENKGWIAASACAVARNGYLAEIGDSAEQHAIFEELKNHAGIDISKTQNQFGTASVWIGGTDAGTEGQWIWDGDNDGVGPQFWSGGPNGSPVGGSYTNWGISPPEPDNSGGQDHLTIIIKPSAINFGLWNDLVATNQLYYLIEYDSGLGYHSKLIQDQIKIYPNPFEDYLIIRKSEGFEIEHIEIYHSNGQKVFNLVPMNSAEVEIDVDHLESGLYLIKIYGENAMEVSRMLIK